MNDFLTSNCLQDEYARNYSALTELYGEWARGQPERFALVAGGAVQEVYGAPAAARNAVQSLSGDVTHALVVALWPLGGWRHLRFAIDSYHRSGTAPSPLAEGGPLSVSYVDLDDQRPQSPYAAIRPQSEATVGRALSTGPACPLTTPADPLARDFLIAEQLRHGTPSLEDLQAPYVLIKDGAVLARYERVTQARQAVDAAFPPLAPVVFTSLRPGHLAPFSIIVLHALVDGASFHLGCRSRKIEEGQRPP